MVQGELDPLLLQALSKSQEPLQLLLRIALVHMVGGGEVGEETLDFEAWEAGNCGDLSQTVVRSAARRLARFRLARQQAKPPHPCVHFDMHPKLLALGSCLPCQRHRRLVRKDSLRQIEIEEGFDRLRRREPENQDRGTDSCPSELDGLVESGHAETVRSRLESHLRHGHPAMSITIGLDHGHETRLWAGDPAQLGDVVPVRRQVDHCPCQRFAQDVFPEENRPPRGIIPGGAGRMIPMASAA